MSAAGPTAFFESQLTSIFAKLDDINTKLALLQRQDDLSTAERQNLIYRVNEAEKAIHALEAAPAQRQKSLLEQGNCLVQVIVAAFIGSQVLIGLGTLAIGAIALFH